MGGSAPSIQKNFAQQFGAYLKYLPQLLQTTAAQQPGVEQSNLEAAQKVSPGYAQLGLGQLNQYGVPYTEAGNAISRANATGGAETNTALLEGAGGDSARAADKLNRELNPDYYSTRTLTGNSLKDLVNSINLNGLSGGERAEVERSLNQSNTATGNLGLDNATNAVGNAMQFGNALNAKRTMLGNALTQATNFMTNSQNTSFNPTTLALAPTATTGANPGLTAFSPVKPTGDQAIGFGSSVLGGINATGNASLNAQAQSNYNNSAAGVLNSLPSYS